MTRIVTIKFRTAGKQYNFNAGELELAAGQAVVVETDRGRALGNVVTPPREVPEDQIPDNLKNILRPATEEDLDLAEKSATKEREAFRFCLERIKARGMDMKLVRAEYLFDGSKIIFFFTADGRVDFRELVKDLAHFFHTRIEMRQIGVRDEAKLIGGIGICGRSLCCCTFLTDFVPVSVKMAKEQGLALNPNKISGQCGRLLCCLNYEYKTYLALRQRLPKCGKQVKVEGKEGEIIGQNIFDQTVTVRLPENQQIEVSPENLDAPDSPVKGPEETDQSPAQKTRTRGPQRTRKSARPKEESETPGEEGGKSRRSHGTKPAQKRRPQKPGNRDKTASPEGEQGSARRPRRKSRSRNRTNKNTPSGDKK